MGSFSERGGVLLRFGGADGGDALAFVPVLVARRLTALSSLTPVPGARPPIAGIALADGAVVTVLSLGEAVPHPVTTKRSYEPGEDWVVPGAECALLCHVDGSSVALTGATVLATGVFDAAPDGSGVLWRSEVVPVLDVRALHAQAEATTWPPRAARVPDETGGGR